MPSYLSYKRQIAVLDENNDDITWITVKGNHIPIKKGQNKGEAVKEFFEKKNAGSKSEKVSKKPEKETRMSLALKIAALVKPTKISEKEYARRLVNGVGALKGSSLGELQKLYERRKSDAEKKSEPEKKEFMSKEEFDKVYNNTKKNLSVAAKNEPTITKDLKGIKDIVLYGLDFRLKEKKSAVEKVKRERIENKYKENWHDRKIMNRMYDLVRYTQLVDKDTFVKQAQKTIDELKGRGYKIVELKNFWLPEVNRGKNPYRGINMKWKSPDGQKFELQFNTKNNLTVKDKMHDIYNKQRVLEAGSKEWEDLNNESLKLTKLFDNPKDIEKLVA